MVEFTFVVNHQGWIFKNPDTFISLPSEGIKISTRNIYLKFGVGSIMFYLDMPY